MWNLRRPAPSALLGASTRFPALLLILASVSACRGGERPATGDGYSPSHAALLAQPLPSWLPWRLSGETRLSRHAPAGHTIGAERRRVAQRIDADLERKRSPAHLAAAGVLRLVSGKPAAALELLEEAHDLAPYDPRIASDLATALMVLNGDRDPVAGLRALDLLLGPSTTDGQATWLLYNRALALEHNGLLAEAETTLEAASSRQPDEPSRDLLRARLAAIEKELSAEPWSQARQRLLRAAEEDDHAALERLARRWMLAARDEVEEEVLGAWGEALLAGDATQSHRLRHVAVNIGSVLAAAGDPFVADATASLDLNLASAHRDYRNARRAQARGDFESAEASARSAARSFRLAASPFAEIAERVVATCHYQRGRLDLALAETKSALMRPSVQRYPSVEGRWLWLQGLAQVGTGKPAEALDSYGLAATRFQALGDAEAIALSATFAAETLNYLGQTAEAARSLRIAMQQAARLPGRARLHLVPSEVATLCSRESLLHASLAFENAAIGEADPAGLGFGYLLMERARIHLAQGSRGDAAADLSRARALLDALPTGALRDRTAADLDLADGNLALGADPALAAASLSRGLRYFERVGRTFQPLAGRYQLARAVMAEGRIDEAMRILETGLRSREKLRTVLRSAAQRQTFFDEAQAFFDDLVATAFREGDWAGAFAAAERSRSRVLLDRLAGDEPLAAVVSRPSELAEIRARLPRDAALLEYHFGKDALRVICLTRHGVTGKVLAPREEVIADLRALDRTWRGTGDPNPALAALYDRLIRPLEPALREAHTLILVPHGELVSLPFAALRDRRSQRYLVERGSVVLAPSAAVALPPSRPRPPSGPPTDAIVFADPAVDPRDARFGLRPLSGAREEAALVAAAYPHARMLVGGEARADVFLREAGRHAVVHLAVHGVENRFEPARSFLVFARPSASEGGWVDAERIGASRFPATRLVVLAACNGASGTATKSEGVLSLARAFLAAQVPAVVASLTPVDDRAAAALFAEFHRHFASGSPADEALREAQLHLLHGSDVRLQSPRQWGTYQLIGRAPSAQGRSF